jgi:hypothetical protein
MRPALLIPAAIFAATLALAHGGAAEAASKCPPGHAKKGWCAMGTYRIPPGLDARRWDAWERNGLRPPRRGESYRVVDGDLYLILDATREVLEALGAIERVVR